MLSLNLICSFSLSVPSKCSVELSLKGFEFLHNLFKKYDKDNDNCLNQNELNDLFSVCPISVPWGKDVHNTVETDLDKKLTYCGFLSQWVYVFPLSRVKERFIKNLIQRIFLQNNNLDILVPFFWIKIKNQKNYLIVSSFITFSNIKSTKIFFEKKFEKWRVNTRKVKIIENH